MESIVVACITGLVTLIGVILSNSKSRAVREVAVDPPRLREPGVVGHLGEHPLEVGALVEAVELCGDDDGVDGRRRLGAPHRVGEEKVFLLCALTHSRKNWLFCDTPSGAEASCAAYSVVTTARACGLDDRSYVEWLLSEMPNDPALRAGGADTSRYLPWSPEVPESCRATGAHFREELGVAGEPVVGLAGIAARGSD